MGKLNIAHEFPELRVPLDFGEYHPDLAGNTVEVWVNPSVEFIERWQQYVAGVERAAKADPDGPLPDDLVQERAALFAQLWNIPEEDVAALFDNPAASGLCNWARQRTWELIDEYGKRRGKSASG